MTTMREACVPIPVDVDIERARLALSNAYERWEGEDAVLDEFNAAFAAMARANAIIDMAKRWRGDR